MNKTKTKSIEMLRDRDVRPYGLKKTGAVWKDCPVHIADQLIDQSFAKLFIKKQKKEAKSSIPRTSLGKDIL